MSIAKRFITGLAAGIVFAGALSLSAAAQSEARPVSRAGPADDAPNGRLPQNIQPTAYALDLKIDPREPEFSGRVVIDLTFDEKTDRIWLHGNNLTVDEAALETQSGERVAAAYNQVLETGVSQVSLASAVPAGDHRLILEYTAPFDPNLAGMFRVERGGDWYALAKSESVQARKAVPGFDEPVFKALWDISMTVPEGYAAIGIAPVKRREPAGEGFERVVFETSRPTSTYLLSFAVGPFERFDAEPLPPSAVRDREIPVAGWARRGKAGELAFIMGLTQDMVAYFEAVTGTPYPYQKLDIIAAPDWPSGATELASAPTYREEIILSDGEPGPVKMRRIVGIHAHELAHMWFGDLVTPPWWDDLWLKEGFAVWGTPGAAAAWNPEGGYELNATRDAVDGLRADALATARAVREPIDRNEDIRSAYDGITYDKGSAILRMAEAYLGPETWRAGLKTYFDEYADRAANANDFSRVMGKAAGDPAFEASLNSFLNQNGAPLLRFARAETEEGAPALRVSQSRYRPLGSPIDEGRDWITPVCVRVPSGSECGLIEGEEGEASLAGEASPAWFMPNADGAGYYRFALDAEDWRALNANFAALSANEALMALDSAGAGFEAGELGAAETLDLIEIAARADDQEVRWEAAELFARFVDRLYGDADPARAALSAYAQSLFAEQYAALAGATAAGDALYRQRLRGFLTETGRDEALRAELASAVAAYVGLESDPDPQALSGDDFFAAAKIGAEEYGRAFLDAFFANRETINDAAFARAVLAAAGLAGDTAEWERLLDLALSDDLEASESFTLIASLMANDEARANVWDWIEANAEAVAAKAPAQWRRRVPALASEFCDEARIEDLDAFVAERGSLFPGYERGVAQAREQIALCAAFREAKASEFASAVRARVD